jgi:hypothetical protein
MTRLLAAALLLAGCAQKPAPKPEPPLLGNATQSTIATINGQAVPCYSDTSGGFRCGAYTKDDWKTTKGGVDIRDEERLVDAMQLALALEGMRLDRVKQGNEIAALKRRVAELERKVGDGANFSVSWCGVEKEGRMYWEACK